MAGWSAIRPKARWWCWRPRAASTRCETRKEFPRVAEVPFDAAYKLMATFHRMTDADGRQVIRCFVKGAPDQLLARAANALTAEGKLEPVDIRPRSVSGSTTRSWAKRACASWRSPAAIFPGDIRPERGRLAAAGQRPDAAGAGRHRRSAATRGQGGHRRGARGRHPGAHDHRRPRGDGGGDRRPAGHSRAERSPAPSSRP